MRARGAELDMGIVVNTTSVAREVQWGTMGDQPQQQERESRQRRYLLIAREKEVGVVQGSEQARQAGLCRDCRRSSREWQSATC